MKERPCVSLLIDPIAGWLGGLLGDSWVALLRGSPDERAVKASMAAAVEAVLARVDDLGERERIQAGLRDCFTRPPMGDTASGLREAVVLQVSQLRQMSDGQRLFYEAVTVDPDWLEQGTADAFVSAVEEAVAASSLAEAIGRLRHKRVVGELTEIRALLMALPSVTRPRESLQREDEEFLDRYRRHVREHHGKLEPPDFERRRRVDIDALYVSPILAKPGPSGRVVETDIWELIDEIDRTVLLGDPGAGKTTAAQVLMHAHASDHRRRVPFLVTLREFAADQRPLESILEHLTHKLGSLYQCASPDGLVEHLLANGSAIVIFDGLDELLDTSRRLEVTAAVERFCTAYPLTGVLVTSRTIGYDEAALDESQFVRYQIASFDDKRVEEYVRNWFAQEVDLTSEESERYATDFLRDSTGERDLRNNPLMLALMCILYRGEGSIPRSRPEVYEQCSNLLLRRWDARRRIHVDLRARNLVEPVLRHIAYWLFTRTSEPAATEREIVAECTAFFQEHGFERFHDADESAKEFVEFCRGRAWVLTDVGSTFRGESLFGFTHRTFMEYFAAVELASMYDRPEQLARRLLPRIARQEWEIVSQLAVQIKDRTAARGARRIVEVLLSDQRYRSLRARANILAFVGRCTTSVYLPAPLLRRITRATIDLAFGPRERNQPRLVPYAWLMAGAADHFETVSDEIERELDKRIQSPDLTVQELALRLACFGSYSPWIIGSNNPITQQWIDFGKANVIRYEDKLRELAPEVKEFSIALYEFDRIALASILSWHGLGILYSYTTMVGSAETTSVVFDSPVNWLLNNSAQFDATRLAAQLSAVEMYFDASGNPPWLDQEQGLRSSEFERDLKGSGQALDSLELEPKQRAALGVLLFICAELAVGEDLAEAVEQKESICEFAPYLRARRSSSTDLLNLDVPARYKDLFASWSQGTIDFVRKSQQTGS